MRFSVEHHFSTHYATKSFEIRPKFSCTKQLYLISELGDAEYCIERTLLIVEDLIEAPTISRVIVKASNKYLIVSIFVHIYSRIHRMPTLILNLSLAGAG